MRSRRPPPPPRGKGVYGALVVLFVLAGFILQFRWMQSASDRGSDDIVLPAFARKISAWMLHKRGLPNEPGTAGAGGIEKIPCETCMGSGTLYGDDGREAMCPICQGVGYRMVRRFEPGERICPACAGMGRVIFSDTGLADTCPRCQGRGLIRTAPSPESVP